MLPDNVLLETFELYLGKDDPIRLGRIYGHDYDYDEWQTLVHVCRRWRCIVFASPRRLDLKLYCTGKRLVNSNTLDVWPALPIVIVTEGMQSKEDAINIIAALRHHNRVCKIDCSSEQFQDFLLEEFAAIDEPFLALTSLALSSYRQQNVPVLPDSFLGGSAPCLRSLHLYGIPYPSVGKLLLSTTNIVHLNLSSIPHSGYISPETFVPCLSMSARLESLDLGFRYPLSRAHRASRHPPPLTRVAFPNLTSLCFSGDMEYLEDILSQIETPMLKCGRFYFFNQLLFDTQLLGHFIRRTETFMTIHRARIEFNTSTVWITFWGLEASEPLWLDIRCGPLDWQLSALVPILNSILSSLPALEILEIAVSREDWQVDIGAIQWQEFFHVFTSVKDMILERENSVRLIAPVLQELAGERATEVLPALQNLFLPTHYWQPSEPIKEAIEQFIATRQLCGHPVTVHQ